MNVSLGVARARLVSQIRGGGLLTASQDAYAAGIAALSSDGEPGSGPAMSRLVEVRVREPVTHGNSVLVALRWEAIGPRGELFPALDANLTLVPAGQQSTTMRLAAAYRPPPDAGGAQPGPLAVNQMAAATVQEFLSRIGAAVTSSAPVAGQRPGNGHREPDAEAS